MFFSSVFLFESFNASYTSFLSVISFTKPFETMAELEQTDFEIGGIGGGATRTMFGVEHKCCKTCLDFWFWSDIQCGEQEVGKLF